MFIYKTPERRSTGILLFLDHVLTLYNRGLGTSQK